MICSFCGLEIKKGNGWHIRQCISKYVDNMSDNTKKDIEQKYVNEEYSILDLANVYGLKRSSMEKILEKLNIPLRTLKESSKTKRFHEKYKNTCLTKYGVEHTFSKDCEIRKKWEQELFENEGITNVFQRDDVKQKIKKSIVEHYGENAYSIVNSKEFCICKWIHDGLSFDDAVKKWNDVCCKRGNSMRLQYYQEKYGLVDGEKIYNERIKNSGKHHINTSSKISSLNIKMYELLDSLNITYEKEFCLYVTNDKYETLQRRVLFYDIRIGKLIIEINGDYWHANPKKYKENDLLTFPNDKLIFAKDLWLRDEMKKMFAESYGYTVLYFWESDINDNDTFLNIKKFFENYATSKNIKN